MPKNPQRLDERDAFVALMLREGARSYLEIGLKYGDTFGFVAERIPPNSKMVGVDLPGHGPWGVAPADAHRAKRLIKLHMRQAARRQKVVVIWGDSAARGTVARVQERAPYDLVFIDGDHRSEGVRADWENYGPMARMVAFHDIDAANGKLEPERLALYGVHELWAELKQRYRHAEIIGRERGMGIGVLWNA